MRDGFIIDVGNHQQLMEKKGHYADLVQKQMGIWQPEPEKTENLTPVV
jgi:hypothetical protein